MATMTGVYGTYGTPAPYYIVEPPSIIEARRAVDEALNEIVVPFVNQVIQGTMVGFKALDAGDFITLDELEALVSKQ